MKQQLRNDPTYDENRFGGAHMCEPLGETGKGGGICSNGGDGKHWDS